MPIWASNISMLLRCLKSALKMCGMKLIITRLVMSLGIRLSRSSSGQRSMRLNLLKSVDWLRRRNKEF
jgi:hypothetical protein